MKKLFLAIAHFFEKLDHDAIMLIHFLDSVFTGQEVQAAIAHVETAAAQFVEKRIDDAGKAVEADVAKAIANTQRREWVVGMLVKAGMNESRARVLTESVVALAKKKVDGLLGAIAQHYESAAAVN